MMSDILEGMETRFLWREAWRPSLAYHIRFCESPPALHLSRCQGGSKVPRQPQISGQVGSYNALLCAELPRSVALAVDVYFS